MNMPGNNQDSAFDFKRRDDPEKKRQERSQRMALAATGLRQLAALPTT